MVSFTLNNRQISVDADPSTPLLWARLDGDQIWLRRRSLRRLHDPHRRHGATLVPDRHWLGRRQKGPHHRGPVGHILSSVTESVAGRRSAAVRVLPIGTDHEGSGASREKSETVPRRNYHPHGREYLPLRHLSPHHRRHRARSEGGLSHDYHRSAYLAARRHCWLGWNGVLHRGWKRRRAPDVTSAGECPSKCGDYSMGPHRARRHDYDTQRRSRNGPGLDDLTAAHRGGGDGR